MYKGKRQDMQEIKEIKAKLDNLEYQKWSLGMQSKHLKEKLQQKRDHWEKRCKQVDENGKVVYIEPYNKENITEERKNMIARYKAEIEKTISKLEKLEFETIKLTKQLEAKMANVKQNDENAKQDRINKFGNFVDKLGEGAEKIAGKALDGLNSAEQHLINGAEKAIDKTINGMNNWCKRIQKANPRLAKALFLQHDETFNFEGDGVTHYDMGGCGYAVVNGERVRVGSPTPVKISSAKVYVSGDGAINWGHPKNKELLSKPEVVAEIIKARPESLKTLPASVYGLNPKLFTGKFGEGVMKNSNEAENKSEYFDSMTDILKNKKLELQAERQKEAEIEAQRRKEQEAERQSRENFNREMGGE